MEPSTVLVATKTAKPSRVWIVVTLIAGAVGAFGAVAGGGTGTYDVEPYRVELRARPTALGVTELAIRPDEVNPLATAADAYAEAGTHNAPMAFRATIVDARLGAVTDADRAQIATPRQMASFIGREGKDAVRSFGIKLAGLALAGGAGAGLVISFGRWRRVLGGAVAGLLVFAVVGVLVQQTYDPEEFSRTSFRARPTDRGPELPDLPTP